MGLLSSLSNILAHSEKDIGSSIIPQAMEILGLTETGNIQSSALGRKLRVKIMQHIGLLEIGPSKREDIKISENLEGVIDFLLASLSDKVVPACGDC